MIRFGPFQVDLAAREVRKEGRKVKLQEQPFHVLALLLQRPGQVVSREELQQALWPADTFVEFDRGLNTAIKKIRQTLGDSADTPQFIETLPRQGYRFIGSIEADAGQIKPRQERRNRLRFGLLAGAGVLAIASLASWINSTFGRRAPPASGIYLAVLPFTNLSSDPENAYFAQGLKEELIQVLTNAEPLRVVEVPKAERIEELVGKFILRAVLAGSVRKSGDRLRITVNLIDPDDKHHLWSATYDREFKDVFIVEEEIARQIGRVLEVPLVGNQNKTLVRDYSVNLEAYSLYLKGRYTLNMWGIERAEKAIQYFGQAIAKDSSYALAYTGLADSYDILGDMEVWPATEAFERSRQAVYKALELDPGLPEAIAARGSLAVESWDWPALERDLRQAIQLKPNYQPAHRWLGAVLASLGRREEALAEMKRAWELNPIAPSTNLTMARIDYWYGRSNDAMRQSQKTLELAPDWPSVHLLMGLIYERRGEPAPALTEVTKAAELSARAPSELSFLGRAYAIYGRRKEAQEILALLIARSREEYVAPLNMARVYAGLGDRGRACEWLEKAYQKGGIHWPFWLVDPMWDSLRSEPRFVAVVNKVGLKRY